MDEKKIVSVEGHVLSSKNQPETKRAKERNKEDRSYVPVIVKRIDEAVRHPDDTLERAIKEGLEQHRRSKLSLFLSAIAAGLILGFAGMCVALVSQIFVGEENFILNRLAVALVYPLGFVVCIMSGTQLFTEHTATAVYPVLDDKTHFKSLILLWCIVLLGNLFGTLISSYLLFMADNVINAKEGYIYVMNHLIHFSSLEVFISAILAGWLMAQGGWLVLATPPASSQLLCIYIVTFIIGLGGLHHSIAGSAEVFSGLFHVENPEWLKSFKFLASAVIGNLVGGSLFVAVLNYGHIKKTQSYDEGESTYESK
ncbi:MAG: formate/nitrite transporter family protein [Bacteriovoracaceae bacterium]|jgi:formate/nitrite transporter FocA (FNT family)|nr:formate transporter [Halobacteriovoraceae bacterium]MDP7321137.1 formate/nitrite transporter family protein [Bacteriovoracaceae bacterium]